MKRSFIRPAALSLIGVAIIFSSAARAETNEVVGIADGDTIAVLDSTGEREVIRLAGIDAPEHNQSFGERSTQSLAALVLGKSVTLDCGGEQSYARLVCKVFLPNGEDVGLDQIKAGLAWHYKQYAFNQTTMDRQAYAAAEDAARQAHSGLWADAHPVQPQDFRHGTQSPLCLNNLDHRVACSEQYQGPVRGNARSHIFHWPACPDYDDIAEHNRVSFSSAAAAEAGGFRAARNCP